MKLRYLTLAPLLFIVACSSEEGHVTNPEGTRVTSTPLITTSAVAERFSFPLHGSVTEKVADVSKVHEGTSETLVEYTGTGAVMAWSAPSSPQAQAGWPASLAEHDKMANAYFVALGVPAAELGSVTHFSGHSKGAPTSNPSAEQVTELGYTTSFRRAVAGFDVVDSRASVHLNAQGQPVAFHLFWPDVPSSVLAQAQSLKTVLASGWAPQPGAVGAGWQTTKTYVTIHHGMAGDATLNWQATIRVELMSGTKSSYVDYDAAGQRVYVYGGTVPSPQNR